MVDKEVVKEYHARDLTIVWKPKTCIHAAVCVKKLPNVYKPNEKPWIQPEGATHIELMEQIDACPSGALSYYKKDQKVKMEEDQNSNQATQVKVIPNGPLQVFCDVSVTDAFGKVTEKQTRASFCRCGASANKPYCDGSHKGIGFTD